MFGYGAAGSIASCAGNLSGCRLESDGDPQDGACFLCGKNFVLDLCRQLWMEAPPRNAVLPANAGALKRRYSLLERPAAADQLR